MGTSALPSLVPSIVLQGERTNSDPQQPPGPEPPLPHHFFG